MFFVLIFTIGTFSRAAITAILKCSDIKVKRIKEIAENEVICTSKPIVPSGIKRRRIKPEHNKAFLSVLI